MTRPLALALALALDVAIAVLAPTTLAEDLAKHSPSKLAWSEQGLSCRCDRAER